MVSNSYVLLKLPRTGVPLLRWQYYPRDPIMYVFWLISDSHCSLLIRIYSLCTLRLKLIWALSFSSFGKPTSVHHPQTLSFKGVPCNRFYVLDCQIPAAVAQCGDFPRGSIFPNLAGLEIGDPAADGNLNSGSLHVSSDLLSLNDLHR